LASAEISNLNGVRNYDFVASLWIANKNALTNVVNAADLYVVCGKCVPKSIFRALFGQV
jgi:hypothetical protein